MEVYPILGSFSAGNYSILYQQVGLT